MSQSPQHSSDLRVEFILFGHCSANSLMQLQSLVCIDDCNSVDKQVAKIIFTCLI